MSFLTIFWVISGAIFGSVGVAMLASAASGPPRGDPNLDGMFLLLFLTTVGGAILGGVLAWKARRKHAGNERRIGQLAILPMIVAIGLMIFAMAKA